MQFDLKNTCFPPKNSGAETQGNGIKRQHSLQSAVVSEKKFAVVLAGRLGDRQKKDLPVVAEVARFEPARPKSSDFGYGKNQLPLALASCHHERRVTTQPAPSTLWRPVAMDRVDV